MGVQAALAVFAFLVVSGRFSVAAGQVLAGADVFLGSAVFGSPADAVWLLLSAGVVAVSSCCAAVC